MIRGKIYTGLFLIALFAQKLFAHEPLYGMGPDVLFKGGFEPHLTFHFNKYELESEIALAYGITGSWTGAFEMEIVTEDKKSHLGNYVMESNYRFLKIDKPGLSYKASFVSELTMPIENEGEKSLMCAFTAGQEGLKWYWFAHAGFEKNISSSLWNEGNHFTYGVTLGARPHKPDYYKPDFVFLLESTGNFHQQSTAEETNIKIENGNAIDIAPTFVLSYRNVALRSGIQFGLLNSGSAEKTEVNGKIAIEIHL